MKKILCFGDSNTYGYNPLDGSRYDEKTRWTGILKTLLQGEFEVIEAGCNNRTCFENSLEGIEQTGYKSLPKYLTSDIYILIAALGINDLQKFYSPPLDEIKNGIEKLILTAKNINPRLKIIIASPSKLKSSILTGNFAFQFDENSVKTSLKIGEIYKKAAAGHNCGFIDFDKIADFSDIDGLHYMPSQHKLIAEKLYNYILGLKI